MRRADNLTTFMCQLSLNLGVSTSWDPQGLSRPVMGLLYLYLGAAISQLFFPLSKQCSSRHMSFVHHNMRITPLNVRSKGMLIFINTTARTWNTAIPRVHLSVLRVYLRARKVNKSRQMWCSPNSDLVSACVHHHHHTNCTYHKTTVYKLLSHKNILQ